MDNEELMWMDQIRREYDVEIDLDEKMTAEADDTREKQSGDFAKIERLKRSRAIVASALIQEKRYKCIICSELFKYSCFLNRHMTKHSMRKNYECPVCQKTFKWLSSLKKHDQIHDVNRSTRNDCKICSEKFNSRSKLLKHQSMHMDHRPLECVICQKMYLHVFDLGHHYGMRHMNLVNLKRRYECEVCHMDFPIQAVLRRHLMAHSLDKRSKVTIRNSLLC